MNTAKLDTVTQALYMLGLQAAAEKAHVPMTLERAHSIVMTRYAEVNTEMRRLVLEGRNANTALRAIGADVRNTVSNLLRTNKGE